MKIQLSFLKPGPLTKILSDINFTIVNFCNCLLENTVKTFDNFAFKVGNREYFCRIF